MNLGLRSIGSALLVAALGASWNSGEPATTPRSREALLLERKIEVRQVFVREPLRAARRAAIGQAVAEAAAFRELGDRTGEMAALTRAARQVDERADDPWNEACGALVPRFDCHLIEGSRRLTVRFEWLYPPANLPSEACALEVELASAPPLAVGATPQRVARLAERGNVVLDPTAPPPPIELAFDGTRAGSFQLTVTLRDATGDRHRVDHTAPIAFADGWSERVAALEERRLELAARAVATADRGAAHACNVAALPADLLAQVVAGKREWSESLLEIEWTRAEELLADVERGAPPPIDRGWVRCVERLPSTGELLPWLLYLPSACVTNAEEARPLLVALHGLGVREESWLRYGDGALTREAERRGMVVAVPHGWRVDSFYVGPGEEDVLHVIDAALERARIDRDRISLIGHSMGAFGTLRIGSRHADRFAAQVAIAGGGNLDWIDGARDLPTLLVHGDADEVVPVGLSRALASVAKARGLPWRYWEIPGARHVEVVAQSLPEVLDFCMSARRLVR